MDYRWLSFFSESCLKFQNTVKNSKFDSWYQKERAMDF